VRQAITRILLVSQEKRDYLRLSQLLLGHQDADYVIDWVTTEEQLSRFLSRSHDRLVVLYVATGEFLAFWNSWSARRVPCPWVIIHNELERSPAIREGALTLAEKMLEEDILLAAIEDAVEHFMQYEYMQLEEHKDPLTGLGGRSIFHTDIDLLIHHHKSLAAEFGLVYIDIVELKSINDRYGRHAGDEVLKTLAKRCVECAPDAHVYRYTSDEILLLIEHIENVSALSPVIERIECAVNLPVSYQQATIPVQAVLGVASYPAAGTNSRDLIRNADMAAYEAAQQGASSLFFDYRYGQSSKEVDLISELRLAIRSGDMQLNYQPRVNPNTGEVHSLEALGRWNHWREGQVNPSEYIALAERTGLVVEYGRWALEQVCRDVSMLRKLGYDTVIAVNIGYEQLLDGRLNSDFETLLSVYDIPASAIEIELTETVRVDRLDLLAKSMNELKEIGVSFALDDFGTGFSAFTHLQQLPIDMIKIDKAFITDIEHSETDRAIVTTINNMAKRLGIETVAEGVETENQLSLLRQMDCQLVQGYLFSRPKRIDKLIAGINASSQMNFSTSKEEATAV